MMVRFTKQVSALRRVAIPKKLAAAAAIPHEGFVLVSKPGKARLVLLLSPAAPDDTLPIRDPARPRQLNIAGQVTLPAPLMDAVKLAPLQWVYLSKAESGTGVLIEPAGDL